MTRRIAAVALVVTAAVGHATTPASAQEPEQQPGGNAPTVSGSQVIGAQGADEWLASQLRGTTVIGSDGEKIGEIVDVLLDRNGRARGYVVGVGGVMGLGSKEVAIDIAQFREIPAAPANGGARAELKIPLTSEQLAMVPEFRPLPVPDAETTGSAPPSPK